MKQFFTLFLSLLISILSFAQGAESFTNMPAGVASYATNTWVGDGGISWLAGSARTDGSTVSTAITGMNGRFIIMRNTGGILSATNLPNGIGSLSFLYAKAFTSASNIPTFAVFVNGVQIGSTITASSNVAQTATFTPNISGTFSLEIRQLTANDNGRLAIDNITWTSNITLTPCPEPTAQPTGPITFYSKPNFYHREFYCCKSCTRSIYCYKKYIKLLRTLLTVTANSIGFRKCRSR